MGIDYASIIKDKRLHAFMSQGELAEKAGCSRTTISAIERNTRDVGIDVIQNVLAVLGMRLEVVER